MSQLEPQVARITNKLKVKKKVINGVKPTHSKKGKERKEKQIKRL